MDLTFLGSANAFAADGRYWSSFIVNGKYQFDAPPTLLPHLKQLNVDLTEIEVIFISHGHGDHFVGLPFLYLEYMYMTQRTKDLTIVGPPGCEEWLEDFAERVYPNILQEAGYRRVYVEADPAQEVQHAADITFRAYPMNHAEEQPRGAYGFRVQIGDQTVAYTGDTMFAEEVVQLGDGSDVFVVDCTYCVDCGPAHMSLDDIKVIRERISPETKIILTHLGGVPVLNGMRNTMVAEDLKTFRF
ncbi:MAG TPA: ribonuclease Z [Dehalococcoidia bacterium]|nr:ribonuclease Z [Dehalococcoidia bacterium]